MKGKEDGESDGRQIFAPKKQKVSVNTIFARTHQDEDNCHYVSCGFAIYAMWKWHCINSFNGLELTIFAPAVVLLDANSPQK